MAKYWIDTGYGGRVPKNTLSAARKFAMSVYSQLDYPDRPTARAVSSIVPTDRKLKVRIFASETGQKEVGYVEGRDGWYWVTYDPAWGVASFGILSNGKLAR